MPTGPFLITASFVFHLIYANSDPIAGDKKQTYIYLRLISISGLVAIEIAKTPPSPRFTSST